MTLIQFFSPSKMWQFLRRIHQKQFNVPAWFFIHSHECHIMRMRSKKSHKIFAALSCMLSFCQCIFTRSLFECAALAQCGQILSKKANFKFWHPCIFTRDFLSFHFFSKIESLCIELSRENIGLQEFEFGLFR